MATLTQEQQAAKAKRERRAASTTPGGTSSASETVSLSEMLGAGNDVVIGGVTYEVAPFPISRLAQVGKLISDCPDILLTAALSAHEGETDAAAITEAMNSIVKQANADAAPVDEQAVEYALSTITLNVSEQNAKAMTDLTVLALKRRHPDIQSEDIADDLDIQSFFAVLCQIFQLNGALKKRF